MTNGEGVQGVFPPLAKSDYLRDSTERSIRVVKYGLQGPITVNGIAYSGIMPSSGLDDDEIADVMNFILNSWGNSSDTLITPERVKLVKEE
jgi:mono/diheme cytochrome c family protein